ncbi:MAG: serine/threonine protein kinase, partial [Myxococcales bacterium]|nr:serine/threonine protein kinase [Myxococcales bacterium]
MGDQRFQTGELILDRYRVQGVLGAGGVGVVYDTMDDRIGRAAAVKVLRRSAQDHRTAARRTVREARTLASLSHPHLVTLLDFEYLDDGCPVLVMERVHGESAAAVLQREGCLPVAAVVDILRQSLGALAELHAAGIIHRDLKPGNILLEQVEPDRFNVKLIDFGIVQLVADDGATALTLSGEVFGSPRYMAPEQWTQKPVEPRTDLYALGLIAHVLLAGDHFIQVRNPVQIFEAHLQPSRPHLTVTGAGEPVPPMLANLVHRAIQPNAEQRFQTAAD